jgi:hypothetical protein
MRRQHVVRRAAVAALPVLTATLLSGCANTNSDHAPAGQFSELKVRLAVADLRP